MARERTSARIDERNSSSTLGSVTAIRKALTVGCVVLVVIDEACTGGTSTHAGRSSAPTQHGPAAEVPAHIDAVGVSPPDGPVAEAPPSIRSDCSADVTDQLQQWLTGVPDGSVATFRKGACYRVESTVTIAEKHDLLLDGRGAVLKSTTKGTRKRAHLRIQSSRNVTVRDLVVRGANPHAGTAENAYQPKLEAQHAYELLGDDGVLLEGVQAYDVYGDFVYIGKSQAGPSKRITVARSHFERNGRQGIAITAAQDVLVVGNEVDDVARSLFDLEPNKAQDEVRRVRIEANTTGPVHNFWFANKGPAASVGDITVMGNVMRAPSGGLVFVFAPADGARGPFKFDQNLFRVTGSVTDEDATGAFLFAHADGVTVTHNTVEVSTPGRLSGVELRATDGVVVTGNRFLGATNAVIGAGTSKDVHVADNDAH